MSSDEYLKLENKLNQVIGLIDMITPSQFALSQISDMTGKSSKTVYKYLKSNYLENMDFKKLNGKIVVNKEVGIELIRRYRL